MFHSCSLHASSTCPHCFILSSSARHECSTDAHRNPHGCVETWLEHHVLLSGRTCWHLETVEMAVARVLSSNSQCKCMKTSTKSTQRWSSEREKIWKLKPAKSSLDSVLNHGNSPGLGCQKPSSWYCEATGLGFFKLIMLHVASCFYSARLDYSHLDPEHPNDSSRPKLLRLETGKDQDNMIQHCISPLASPEKTGQLVTSTDLLAERLVSDSLDCIYT